MLARLRSIMGFFLAVNILAVAAGERVSYTNYPVYKVSPDSESKLSVLRKLLSAGDWLIFLSDIISVDYPAHVVVTPHKVPDFIAYMKATEITVELVEANFQRLLEADETQEHKNNSKHQQYVWPLKYGWTSYYNLDDTYKWMTKLQKKYPRVITIVKAGESYEKRPILGVKISHQTSRPNHRKPGIFLEAGIHGREWISSTTATYIINELLKSQIKGVQNAARNYDWYIFPHINPDGYEYSRKTDRMWRKTRTPYGSCFGADLNRNWGFHWNEPKGTEGPCDSTYPGPKAFSEKETESLSKYINSLKDDIKLYIAFHSFGQYLLHPYGYTFNMPSIWQDMETVRTATIEELKKRYGTKYIGGSISNKLYPLSGDSIDWVYGNLHVNMTFYYELRPTMENLNGFLLPPSQIKPTGEETLDSLLVMISKIEELGYFS